MASEGIDFDYANLPPGRLQITTLGTKPFILIEVDEDNPDRLGLVVRSGGGLTHDQNDVVAQILAVAAEVTADPEFEDTWTDALVKATSE